MSRRTRRKEPLKQKSKDWRKKGTACLIISHFHKKWLLSKGWKHTKIKAKLSVSFGNLGKTFAMFSSIPDRSRAPKAARLHLESGKTYVKSALLQMAEMFGRIGQSFLPIYHGQSFFPIRYIDKLILTSLFKAQLT